MNKCGMTSNIQSEFQSVDRIIVIGDIHGDWAALKSSLVAAGVTNHHNKWIGGATHLVQVGDLLDRKVRHNDTRNDEKSEQRILNHLFNLQKQAQAVGGDVHMLLGNHELMNIDGDFRYVSPMGMSDFDGQRSKYFKPGGDMAVKMACYMKAIVKIGSWVFSHAGITNDIAKKYTVSEINHHIRNHLLGNHVLDRDHEIMNLFWNRYYGNQANCQLAQSGLKKWKAKNMAIGHTVQTDGINSTCNGSIWRVDIGSSEAFKGKSCYIEVLEILNDGQTINVIKGNRPCKR